jgi:hypothetical protein
MGWLRPNKDRAWLHSSLLESAAEKRKVVFARLLPRVRPVDAAIASRVPNISPMEESVAHRYTRYVIYLFMRMTYNLLALPTTLWHGFCWWRSARS